MVMNSWIKEVKKQPKMYRLRYFASASKRNMEDKAEKNFSGNKEEKKKTKYIGVRSDESSNSERAEREKNKREKIKT